MRYTGPKNKVSRREAADLGLKTVGSKAHANLLKKINVSPGQHGARFKRKLSEHGRQLREKQKLRFTFGLTEGQLKSYFDKVTKKEGNTSVLLGEILERRLDNIVYRLGFAPTRAAARQLVSHGHIMVGGKKLSIPSYMVENGEKIQLNDVTATKIPYISQFREGNSAIIPDWFSVKKNEGVLNSSPTGDIINKQINMRLVIEFYSR
jgi:small subunit ribosomal protein S4